MNGALQRAWSAETSSDPANWTPENPAWGQCAVTALVIQDLLGGDLLRGVVDGHSHYWNRLDNGREIDLTLHQFGPSLDRPEAERRDRSYVLSFPETRRRYRQLLAHLTTEVGR